MSNFQESVFVEHLLATTSHMMFSVFPFCRSARFETENQFIWWSNSKLGEGIHKPVQFCVVMEIRWKRQSSCGYTSTDLGIGSGRKRTTEEFVKVE